MSEGYKLVMRFLDESPSFCHGYGCGQIHERMKSGQKIEQQAVNIENKEQLQMIANLFNYTATFQACNVEGWIYLTAEPEAGPEAKRKTFKAIEGGLA